MVLFASILFCIMTIVVFNRLTYFFFFFLSIFRIRTTISSFLKSRATTTSLWMPGKRDTVSKEQPPSTDLSSYAKTSTTWKCPKWSPTTQTGNFLFVSISCHFPRQRRVSVFFVKSQRSLPFFSSALNCVRWVSVFFREIATFIYRLLSFNDFFSSTAWPKRRL